MENNVIDTKSSDEFDLDFQRANSSLIELDLKDAESKKEFNIDNENLEKTNESCKIKLKLHNILYSSIEFKHSSTSESPPKINKESIWKKLKNKMSNLKNNIKYNTVTLNSFFDFYEFDRIKLFNCIYSTKTDLKRFCQDFYNLIYMSYRNQFDKILNQNTNKIYTTDCGWGCMIRSAQMILARGIQMIKAETSQESIREIILLFADSPLPLQDLLGNKILVDITSNIINDLIDKKDVINTDDTPLERSDSYTSAFEQIKSVTSPFSIRNICQLGEAYDKGAGEWFSDVNMNNIFLHLNNEFNPVENMKIVTFNEGVIYNSDLIEECFVPIEDKSIIENEKNDNLDNTNANVNNLLKFNEKFYKFNSPCILFVSFRLGIERISEKYHENIKRIFDIPYNLGIIGGNSDSAHYFIGIADDYLLYLDPHLNQKSLNSVKEFETSLDTYVNKRIYKLHVKNMSPGFSVGFYFRNFYEYIELSNYLKYYSKNNNSDNFFIKFEDKRKEFTETQFDLIENDRDDF